MKFKKRDLFFISSDKTLFFFDFPKTNFITRRKNYSPAFQSRFLFFAERFFKRVQKLTDHFPARKF